jgi:hypothetical protein
MSAARAQPERSQSAARAQPERKVDGDSIRRGRQALSTEKFKLLRGQVHRIFVLFLSYLLIVVRRRSLRNLHKFVSINVINYIN